MDSELAGAVIQRWEEGLPVAETVFYKAAAVLGIDPEAALIEARFYTNLDSFLIEKRAMTKAERQYFSAAAGSPSMTKVASRYSRVLNFDDVIIKALYDRDFVPDIEKLAFLGMQGGPSEGPSMDMEGSAGQPPSPQTQPAPGANVQQAPQARQMVNPSPTAPAQVPPSPEGNLAELLQMGNQGQAPGQDGGAGPGQPGAEGQPAGAQQDPSQSQEPPSPEQILQQVCPDLHPENLPRYAQKFYEFQQQMGMPISDPAQIQKFVQQLQKADKKVIDQGIKEMGEQMEAEMGVSAGQGGQLPSVGPPTTENTQSPKKPDPQQAQGQPQKPQQKSQQKPQQQAKPTPNAMAKMAAAGRIMARVKGRR